MLQMTGLRNQAGQMYLKSTFHVQSNSKGFTEKCNEFRHRLKKHMNKSINMRQMKNHNQLISNYLPMKSRIAKLSNY